MNRWDYHDNVCCSAKRRTPGPIPRAVTPAQRAAVATPADTPTSISAATGIHAQALNAVDPITVEVDPITASVS